MKKKFLLLSGLVLSTCTVLQAQNYAVGGSVKAWHNHQDGITSFSVAPDIGYTLSDKWYIDMALGYSYLKKRNQDQFCLTNAIRTIFLLCIWKTEIICGQYSRHFTR